MNMVMYLLILIVMKKLRVNVMEMFYKKLTPLKIKQNQKILKIFQGHYHLLLSQLSAFGLLIMEVQLIQSLRRILL